MRDPLLPLPGRRSRVGKAAQVLLLVILTLSTAGCLTDVGAGVLPPAAGDPTGPAAAATPFSLPPDAGRPAPVQPSPTPFGPQTSPAPAGPTAPLAQPEAQPQPEAAVPTNSPPTPTAPSGPAAGPFPSLIERELPAGGPGFLLPLTIHHIRADGAVLFFELGEPAAEGYLLYQQVLPQPAPTQAVALAPGQTRHQVVLEGLEPGAEYLAVVALTGAGGELQQPAFLGDAWGSVRVRTLTGRAPLRVGVFGDASFGDPASAQLVELMAGQDLDYVLHTGDVVAQLHEDPNPVEGYANKYYQTLAPLLHQLPVYTVIGNHDHDPAARWQDSYFYYYAFPPFPDPVFGTPPQPEKKQYYAIPAGDIQFLMLDSQVIFGVSGREAQQAWLNERLADPNFRYSIPIFHVAPFFSASVHPDDQYPVRRTWHPLFAEARVPLSLSGHSHHYERLEADGITYIVTGGGSRILYALGERQPHSQVYARRTHFTLLEIYPERIELSAVSMEGEVFDEAVVPLP